MSETESEAAGERPSAEAAGEAAETPGPETAQADARPVPAARPPARDDGFEQRHPDALRLEVAVGGAVTGGLALAALLAATLLVLVAGLPPWLWLAALAVPLVLVFPLVIYPRWRHQHYRYRADERGLELRKGVWWRSQRFIPRTRLQHTDLAQGPLERQFGLANLVIHTAGTQAARTTVTGLSLATATEVRDRLTGETEDAGADGV